MKKQANSSDSPSKRAAALSVTKMQEQFDGEWILLEDPKTTATLEVVKGRVLWHSKNRDEVYRKARELRPKHSAVLYLGTLPADMEVVL